MALDTLLVIGAPGDGKSPPWALALMGVVIVVVGVISYLRKK